MQTGAVPTKVQPLGAGWKSRTVTLESDVLSVRCGPGHNGLEQGHTLGVQRPFGRGQIPASDKLEVTE